MSFGVTQYQTARVQTVGPLTLVVSMYDGALRFLRASIARQAAEDLGGRGVALSRAHAIVTELRATLDHERGAGVAVELDALYDFVLDRIVLATRVGDAGEVEPAIAVLERLASGWRELARRGT